MRVPVAYVFRGLLAALALGALAACAPAPLYKTGPAAVQTTPQQVATSPANFSGALVVWGGKVIGVSNEQDRTDIRILAYPLDSSQRPRIDKDAQGRFTAVVPGFLDPMDYPPGSLMTVAGNVEGTTVAPVGQASYVYPMVHVREGDFHRWTAEEMRKGHPNISIGVGVGGWIH